jgi:hypothetical protein
MMKKDKNGVWRCTKNLKVDKAKDKYQYKYVIDGSEWVHNHATANCTDLQGNTNNCITMPGSSEQSGDFNLSKVRSLFSRIHTECNNRDAAISFDSVSPNVVMTIRHLGSPNFDSYVFLENFAKGVTYNLTVALPGTINSVEFVGYLKENEKELVPQDEQHIYGSFGHTLMTFEEMSEFCAVEKTKAGDNMHFSWMPESFVAVFKIKRNDTEAVKKLDEILIKTDYELMLQEIPETGLNHLLFRCSDEEYDITKGSRGPYGLQNYGEFAYAGITSVMHIINNQKTWGGDFLIEDFSELIENMKAGDWLLEYSLGRLTSYDEPDMNFGKLIKYFSQCVELIKTLPQDLKLKYEIKFFETLYNEVTNEILTMRCQDDFICAA